MAAVPPYRTGTATVTAGSAVVTGNGTAWNIGVVEGGEFFRNGDGFPILSIDSATQLTLALPATAAMAGTGSYAIALARAGAADAVTANARLAQLVSQLQGFSAFFQSLTDDADAPTMRASLGLADMALKAAVAGSDILGNTVSNANLTNMAANTIKGRDSGGGTPQDLTVAQFHATIGDLVIGGLGARVALHSTVSNSYQAVVSGSTLRVKLANGSFLNPGLPGSWRQDGNILPDANESNGCCLWTRIS